MRIKLIIFILLLINIYPADAIWLDGWTHRTQNTPSDGVRPFVYSLNISNSTGTNNATHIYCNGLCQPYFNDVRVFLNNDTTTNLSIWFEDNRTTGLLWINLTANGTIQIFYGNPNASAITSDGDKTFTFFDDFPGVTISTSKWAGTTSGAAVSGGMMTFTGEDPGISIYTKKQINPSNTVRARMKIYTPASYISFFGTANTTGSNTQRSTLYLTYSPTNVLYTQNGTTYSQTNTNTPLNSIFTSEVRTINNTRVDWTNNNATATGSPKTGNIPYEPAELTIFARSSHAVSFNFYYIAVMPAAYPVQTWETWAEPITGEIYNNVTGNTSQNFSSLTGSGIQFSYSPKEGTYYNWIIDGSTVQNTSDSYLNYSLTAGPHTINVTTDGGPPAGVYTYTTSYTLELLTPINTSSTTSPVTLSWREWPTTSPHTWQIATDNQFINVISSGSSSSTTELFTTTQTLDPGVYYWHAKPYGGAYSDWFTFTISPPEATPGRLNITAFDEVTGTRLPTFSAQVYNSTVILNKSAVNGWVNFSESEVIAGEYLIRIVPNSSYASRQVLATSPANVSVYLPSTTNTIDTIAFYLLDYTNKFPWKSSVLSITKNNSVMHSSYFDADAKVAAYLIRGESYGVSVSKGENIQNWGNYISIASGNVEVVIMDIGVNSTLRNPFVYNVTWSSSNITLQWSDSFDVMSNINYSIFKGSSKTLVHQLITSVDHGSSEYIVTNTSDVYYVSVSALTTNGYRNQSYIIDYRAGSSATESESQDLYTWSYGSVVIPPWVKNAFAVMSLAILAGCFGALHRGEGAIITGIMALVFWKWTWLSAVGAGIGFLGAMVLFAVLYHLDSKRKGGGYF